MHLPKIDALDLRPEKDNSHAIVWDWPFLPAAYTVHAVVIVGEEWAADARAWRHKWYPRYRYRPPWRWHWGRILFTLGYACAIATCVYVEVIAWL